jgi:hypothetical protein
VATFGERFLAAIRAKRATGKPLVVHVHSVEYDRSGDHINGRADQCNVGGIEPVQRLAV